jgi:ABC-type transport system involved in multi-copper enzyme maturation permease subunit
MSGLQNVSIDSSRLAGSGAALPAWWLVFKRELNGLWIGGRALILILIFSLMLGVVTYVMASNSELSLIPPKEMVFELLKIAVAAGAFISLIIGADMISGERERATLEWLLLTPVSRRQITIGKFLAAVSPWPAALVITIPYLFVGAQGDDAFGPAVLWGAALGSLLAIALTSLGMLISTWSNSNKTSYFISMGIYLLILVPTQLPGTAQTGAMGRLLKQISPMESVYHFLEKTIVNNRGRAELDTFILAPAIFALLTFALLVALAGSGLQLEARLEGRLGAFFGRFMSAVVLALMLGLTFQVDPALAYQGEATLEGALPLKISINVQTAEVNTGDPVLYETVVTNQGGIETAGLIVAMNIINLNDEGEVVDPEDWSPERTQYLTNLGAGNSTTLSWRVNAILEGDYMVYMVVIPEPTGPGSTSIPVTSPGIHLVVNPFTRLNPLGVLPYVVGGPIVLVIIIFLIYRARRRAIDDGSS